MRGRFSALTASLWLLMAATATAESGIASDAGACADGLEGTSEGACIDEGTVAAYCEPPPQQHYDQCTRGSCGSVPPLGNRCLVDEGGVCMPWQMGLLEGLPCGSDGGFQPELACDLARGCVDLGLGACGGDAGSAPTCVGNVLVIACQEWGQPITIDCAAQGWTCSGGKCRGGQQGERCAPDQLECDDGLSCAPCLDGDVSYCPPCESTADDCEGQLRSQFQCLPRVCEPATFLPTCEDTDVLLVSCSEHGQVERRSCLERVGGSCEDGHCIDAGEGEICNDPALPVLCAAGLECGPGDSFGLRRCVVASADAGAAEPVDAAAPPQADGGSDAGASSAGGPTCNCAVTVGPSHLTSLLSLLLLALLLSCGTGLPLSRMAVSGFFVSHGRRRGAHGSRSGQARAPRRAEQAARRPRSRRP